MVEKWKMYILSLVLEACHLSAHLCARYRTVVQSFGLQTAFGILASGCWSVLIQQWDFSTEASALLLFVLWKETRAHEEQLETAPE